MLNRRVQLHEPSISLGSRSHLGDFRTNLEHRRVAKIAPLNPLIPLAFLQHLRRTQACKSTQDEKWHQIRESSVSRFQEFGKRFYCQDCRCRTNCFRSLDIVERIRDQHAPFPSPREHWRQYLVVVPLTCAMALLVQKSPDIARSNFMNLS